MDGATARSLKGVARFVSFRDPSGRTFFSGERVLRTVNAFAWPELEPFLNSSLCAQLVAEARLVTTQTLSRTRQHYVVEHERIPFASYPYEWAPEMLESAGHLTLDIAQRSLDYGFGLKDASPYNVLFRGPKPVFVDVLSFERRRLHDPLWLPYAQFVRTFLLPLLMDRSFGMSLKATFLSSRDGIEPETAYKAAGLRKFLPPTLGLATIPTWLGRTTAGKDASSRSHQVDPEKARFTLGHLYRSLEKQLKRTMHKRARETAWTYYERDCPYTLQQAVDKRTFVTSILQRQRPQRVLDIGCNTGTFSRLASQVGAEVIAVDADATAVGILWKGAHSENLNILPLVVDFARPSPALGWKNLECESFLSRCYGYFDCVFMLGIIHHLLITERIPLDSILDLAADLTTDGLIIEYIAPDDPMFCSLLRGRDHLHSDFNQHNFETVCKARFNVVEKACVADNRRVLYFLRKKRAG